LPIAAQAYSYAAPSKLSELLNSAGGVGNFLKMMGWGGSGGDAGTISDEENSAIDAAIAAAGGSS
jgi:hypothetical protein